MREHSGTLPISPVRPAPARYVRAVGNQWHFDPDSYLEMVRSEIPSYDELQTKVAAATSAVVARKILDLGSGTGITAQHVISKHPDASLIGGLEGPYDLEPDGADLDGEDPVGRVQSSDALLERIFGF